MMLHILFLFYIQLNYFSLALNCTNVCACFTCIYCSVKVSLSKPEINVPGLIFIEALRFCQKMRQGIRK